MLMQFEEGKDYYYDEQGRMVLTAVFLKKRGFCCHNNCRHCPYDTISKIKTQKSKIQLKT